MGNFLFPIGRLQRVRRRRIFGTKKVSFLSSVGLFVSLAAPVERLSYRQWENATTLSSGFRPRGDEKLHHPKTHTRAHTEDGGAKERRVVVDK